MSVKSNLQTIKLELALRRTNLTSAMKQAADQALVLGLNEILPLVPVDTGNLKSSYSRCSAVTSVNDGQATVTWTSDVPYAEFVENGTSRMTARPHLQAGIFIALPKIQENVKRIFEDAFK